MKGQMKGQIMKAIGMVGLLVAALVSGCSDVISATVPSSLDGEGTVLFIVYDDSGSMEDKVTNAEGKNESKCYVADRALITVGKRFDAYLAANPNRTLGLGIILLREGHLSFNTFNVMKGGVTPFLTNWTKSRGSPTGGTPLGNAMTMAADNMINIKNVSNKHIIVLTDGQSNSGPEPQDVLPKIQNRFKTNGVNLGVHLIAFDISEGIFSVLKQQGATVLGASNEVELNKQFDFILREKIMLEREE